MYTIKTRLYRTTNDEIVPDGHPDAAFLYAVPGRKVTDEEAEKHGLAKIEAKAPDPEPGEEPAAAAPVVKPETKRSGFGRKRKK